MEAVKFIYKTCEAFERQAGASADITATKDEFHRLLEVVAIWETLKIPDKLLDNETHGILSAIRGQAQACYKVLKAFNDEVAKYDPERTVQKPSRIRGAWDKTKWAHYFSPKLVVVRQAISAQVSVLVLLIPTLQA